MGAQRRPREVRVANLDHCERIDDRWHCRAQSPVVGHPAASRQVMAWGFSRSGGAPLRPALQLCPATARRVLRTAAEQGCAAAGKRLPSPVMTTTLAG